MEMVVCSGVAIRLCRDKAWKITIHLRQGYGGTSLKRSVFRSQQEFSGIFEDF
ncbi:MAG: hypothetical protein IKB16_13250 [Lentisphaeria bacterium]|nr:hypothetical protein [Lentisphaeria bacterium]